MIDVLAAANGKTAAIASLATATIVALSFTAADIVTVLGAVGILVGIVVAGILQIMAARLKAVTTHMEAAGEKLDKTLAEAKVIAGHVNSAASVAQSTIDSQALQMEMQRKTIDMLEKQAALLAQATAIRDAHAPAAPAVPALAAEHLEEIEVNTKETAHELKKGAGSKGKAKSG